MGDRWQIPPRQDDLPNRMALSTHAGGAADKAGFYYESLWAIYCMLEILDGRAHSIQIETPGEDAVEYCLQRGTTKEHWQVKRQVTGRTTWSLKKLQPILHFFLTKFRKGESSVFASASDAPELRMLTENAQAARAAGGGLNQFKEHFLNKERTGNFVLLQELIGTNSEEEAFHFLCSVTFHTSRDITMEEQMKPGLTVRFRNSWQNTIAALRELYPVVSQNCRRIRSENGGEPSGQGLKRP